MIEENKKIFLKLSVPQLRRVRLSLLSVSCICNEDDKEVREEISDILDLISVKQKKIKKKVPRRRKRDNNG